MKIIGKTQDELLVEISEEEHKTIRRIAGYTYEEQRQVTVGIKTDIRKFEAVIMEIEAIKALKTQFSTLMRGWEKTAAFISERLALDKKED